MQYARRLLAACVLFSFSSSAAMRADGQALPEDALRPKSILDVMWRVRSYQLRHADSKPDNNWIRGTYYAGLMAMHRATGDARLLEQALAYGQKHGFQPDKASRGSGANSLTTAQTWLELYFIKRDPAMLAPVVKWVNSGAPRTFSGDKAWYFESGRRYVDSLFTGPPTLAMLAKATGNKKYLDVMNAFVWDVHGELFDREAGLFYRDVRFVSPSMHDSLRLGSNGIPSRGQQTSDVHRDADAQPRRAVVYTVTPNGKKVLWSRGNGWAIAGIARVLQYLPEDDPACPRFERLFCTMATSLAKRQGRDGYWRVNLDDPDEFPNPDTSGTGFFCYALAWGVNTGLLDRQTYEPVVRRAWTALSSSVSPEGKLLWCQPVSPGPYEVEKENTTEFGWGIFLLAGSEMLALADYSGGRANATIDPSREREKR